MIKLTLMAAICCCTLTGNAQEFKRFKQEISFGFVKPLKNSAGFSFTTEPKFSVIDKLSIGLRLEGSFWFNTFNTGLQSVDATELVGLSVIPTLDYYFSKRILRPFVGIGYGFYGYPLANNSYTYKRALGLTFDNNMGFMLRGGFELGHFRFSANYNNVTREATTIALPKTTFKENWGYVDLKVGVVIGGKRKN